MQMERKIERREKEFRAWDKFRKLMVGPEYNEDETNIGLLPSCDASGATMYFSNGDITLINVSNENYDIMEFIGIRDKNNKKIYEYDIVKWAALNDVTDSILEKNDDIIGLVMWSNYRCGFIVEQFTKGKWTKKIDNHIFENNTEFYSENGQEFAWGDLEVVGDRYRNSDLLIGGPLEGGNLED